MTPFISYPDMKKKDPYQVIDLRFQVDHITLKKIHLFEECRANPVNAILFIIKIRRREIEMISNGNKLIEVKVLSIKILNFEDFMKKHSLKNNTINELELRRVYNYPIYPRDSKIYSDRGFVNVDHSRVGGSHWTCFHIKDNKSYYFDSFGGVPDKFLLNQLPNSILYRNYKIQDIKSKLCGSYCLYFFYLIERMNCYDTILKRYFG